MQPKFLLSYKVDTSKRELPISLNYISNQWKAHKILKTLQSYKTQQHVLSCVHSTKPRSGRCQHNDKSIIIQWQYLPSQRLWEAWSQRRLQSLASNTYVSKHLIQTINMDLSIFRPECPFPTSKLIHSPECPWWFNGEPSRPKVFLLKLDLDFFLLCTIKEFNNKISIFLYFHVKIP